jgi:hypothetical protein
MKLLLPICTITSEYLPLHSMRHKFISAMTRLSKQQVHVALHQMADIAIVLTRMMLSEFFEDCSQQSLSSQDAAGFVDEAAQ